MAAPIPSDFFRNLKVFASPDHRPFRWEGGQPAALLVHGFPGTPADVRPLGKSLHAAGWTVDAPLLPGFGPDLATLPDRSYAEWVDAVASRVDLLKQDHSPVVVLGHSMGGALSLLTTTLVHADGQILLAPYWRFGQPIHHLLWPVLRPFVRRWRPLKKANFQDPRVRNSVLRMLPDIDLDDPRAQDELRRFVVPTHLLDQLRRLGGVAYAAARRSRVRTLVVQGTRDRLVHPAATAKLFLRLANPAPLELVDGSHNVIKPDDGAWEHVEAAVLRFAGSLLLPGSLRRANQPLSNGFSSTAS
ncbi:MAG: alpha/beta fold hydrolase [Dehalococcoidia bacterium]